MLEFLLKIKHRTNIVETTPNIHTTLDLKNLDILSICILSDIFDTIPKAVPININGKRNVVIKLPIKVISSKSIGCIVDAVTKFPRCYH